VQGPLHTSGNLVLDANGRPVVLRGVNRSGLSDPYRNVSITDGEISQARAWGANVVRVPIAEAFIDPNCSQYMPTYLGMLDAAVQSITSRGMVALIDLHAVTRTPCGQSGTWRMADVGSIAFWKTIAGRYMTNPLVAFDLYNEPNNITSDQWLNGGVLVDYKVLQPAVTWTAAGMQQMLDAIRSTGAANLVTVSGNTYAGDPTPILDGHALAGANIVYALHAYTCPNNSDPSCISKPQNQTQHIDPRWTQVAATYPVMITEFGWPSPWNGTYNDSVIRFAQSQTPTLGWIAFTWDGTKNGSFGLVGNLQTYDPTPAGVPVKAALSAAP
jgi:aryl-phospho-beta-D-glucosidase BglC (GH1 family)